MNLPTRLMPTILALGFGATAVHAAAPPAVLFRAGYNLCRTVPLGALRLAGGQPYGKGVFANGACTWERSDLKAGIVLATHPRPTGVALMRGLLHQNGSNGLQAKRLRIPGTKEAVVATLPRSAPHEVTKDLFAMYAAGVVQLNITEPRSLPDARLVTVLTAVLRAYGQAEH